VITERKGVTVLATVTPLFYWWADASEENEPIPRRMVFFFREMEHKLDELDEYLGKYDQYVRGLERQIHAFGRVLPLKALRIRCVTRRELVIMRVLLVVGLVPILGRGTTHD